MVKLHYSNLPLDEKGGDVPLVEWGCVPPNEKNPQKTGYFPDFTIFFKTLSFLRKSTILEF